MTFPRPWSSTRSPATDSLPCKAHFADGWRSIGNAALDGLEGFRLYEYDGNVFPTIADEYGDTVASAYRAWESDLLEVEARFCPHWDVDFGGLGFGALEMEVVNREVRRRGCLACCVGWAR